MITFRVGDFVVAPDNKVGRIKFFPKSGTVAVQFDSESRTVKNFSMAAVRKATEEEQATYS